MYLEQMLYFAVQMLTSSGIPLQNVEVTLESGEDSQKQQTNASGFAVFLLSRFVQQNGSFKFVSVDLSDEYQQYSSQYLRFEGENVTKTAQMVATPLFSVNVTVYF